jgi:hypothetical protein
MKPISQEFGPWASPLGLAFGLDAIQPAGFAVFSPGERNLCGESQFKMRVKVPRHQVNQFIKNAL